MSYRTKHLSELLADLTGATVHGFGDPSIRSIVYDSRCAEPGCLFAALRGKKTDGSTFIRDAVARGAVAVLGNGCPDDDFGVPFIDVPDARRALADAAWSFFDHPERSMTMVGITGTNGKTTIATILQHVLEYAGYKTGLAGTLGFHYGDVAVETARTTPESIDLAAHFSEMRDRGCSHVVMEATSIGIDLERTWHLPFRTVVFTNLTRDHLDYHGTEEAYLEAKLRLFREQTEDSFSIINTDDPNAGHFVRAARGKVITYAISKRATYMADQIQLSREGIRFSLFTEDSVLPIDAPLIGRFNIFNVLAVFAAARSLGVHAETIQQALKYARPARGRAEIVPSKAPFTVLVDYAHTPDALEKVLTSLRSMKPKRILTVVGAGGDRDKGKRPIMAETAYRLSNLLFLTSDNPRSEDPDQILDEMEAGLPAGSAFQRNADRKNAIRAALAEAGADDVVLIAGKGHETYQEIQGVKHPFDDRAVALEWLRTAGFAQ